MKKIITVVLLVILVMALITACGGNQDAAANPLPGTWKSDEVLGFYQSYTFNEDGTGKADVTLMEYDFKYEYSDGKLDIYSKIFGMESDTPESYTVEVSGDTLKMTDSNGTTTELKKQ